MDRVQNEGQVQWRIERLIDPSYLNLTAEEPKTMLELALKAGTVEVDGEVPLDPTELPPPAVGPAT
jgi:hypothetical protein